MDFKDYFRPSKRNLSLTLVVLTSQLLIFIITTIISTIAVPGFLEGPVPESNPAGDSILFGGIILGNYIAACSCDWWINEHLER